MNAEMPDAEEFEKKHPKAYKRIMLIGVIALLSPMCLLVAYTVFINPSPNSGFLLLVAAGSFIMGVGLFNVVAAWCGQYLGHWLTAICLLLGGLLVTVGMVVMYVPDIYAWFDEEMVNHYFLQLLLSIFIPVEYFVFHWSMEDWMKRKKIGTARIREKLMEGPKNYWFFQALHEEYGLGWRYFLNKIFLWLAVPALFLCVFLGWLRPLATITAAALSASYLLCVPMSILSLIEERITELGSGRFKEKRSPLKDLSAVAISLIMVYCIVTMTIGLYQ